jgi:hypothetical protein
MSIFLDELKRTQPISPERRLSIAQAAPSRLTAHSVFERAIE